MINSFSHESVVSSLTSIISKPLRLPWDLLSAPLREDTLQAMRKQFATMLKTQSGFQNVPFWKMCVNLYSLDSQEGGFLEEKQWLLHCFCLGQRSHMICVVLLLIFRLYLSTL